jgi:hypothetical protein
MRTTLRWAPSSAPIRAVAESSGTAGEADGTWRIYIAACRTGWGVPRFRYCTVMRGFPWHMSSNFLLVEGPGLVNCTMNCRLGYNFASAIARSVDVAPTCYSDPSQQEEIRNWAQG